MMLFAFEDRAEQVAADIVAHAFAVRHRVLEQRDRFFLEREVGLQHFLDRLADAEASQHLEIGEAAEEEEEEFEEDEEEEEDDFDDDFDDEEDEEDEDEDEEEDEYDNPDDEDEDDDYEDDFGDEDE